MVSTEIEIASHQVSNFDDGNNDAVLRQELDLTEEGRDQTYLRTVAYKQKAAQYFNKKV